MRACVCALIHQALKLKVLSAISCAFGAGADLHHSLLDLLLTLRFGVRHGRLGCVSCSERKLVRLLKHSGALSAYR